MTTPVPFDTFAEDLSEGESVQWTGRPNTSVIFHPEDAFMIPFSLMWGGFAIFWLLGASGIWSGWSSKPMHGVQLFGIIWGTPFVLIGQYLIWGRFVYAWWKKCRTYYVLTNRRALIVLYGLSGRSTTSAYLSNLQTIDKRVRGDGIGSIAFGGPVTAEWRSGRNNPPRPPTFEDVDDAESVYREVEKVRSRASALSPGGQ